MAKMCFSLVSLLLVTVHMASKSVEATPVDGEVVFDSSDLLNNLYEMPAACAGQSYCFEKGDNYPEEKIAELLKDMNELQVDTPAELVNSIGSRNGDSYDEPDCPSNSSDKPIYYITDTNGNVRVVVQSPKKFEQIYSVKWCLNEGRITKDTPHFLTRTTLQEFNIECVSTRMNFEFFVLSEDDLKMEPAKAMGGIPVCCRCRYDARDK